MSLTPPSCSLARDRREERARIASPAAVGALVIGNERTRELLDVVADSSISANRSHFTERAIEGIEHDVAASGIVEALQIAAVGIGDDGTVAASERRE